MTIHKEDIADLDLVDAVELGAAGAAADAYRTAVAVISTTAATKRVVVTGGLKSHDTPAEPGDRLLLSGNAAAGTYTIDVVVSDTQLDTVEAIVDSTGGAAEFRHHAGAKRVGVELASLTSVDPTNLHTALSDIAANAIQGDLADDGFVKVTRSGGFITFVTVWTNAGMTQKINEVEITRSGGQTSVVTERQYDAAGVLRRTVTSTLGRVGGQIDSLTQVRT